MLRNAPHYTYNFFPNDDIKKEIPLHVYQRNVYNWKLSCNSNSETSIQTAIEKLNYHLIEDSPWEELDHMIADRSTLSICLISMTIFIFPMIYPFLTVPLVTYLLYKPVDLGMETLKAVKTREIGREVPTWIDQCFD